VRTPALRSRWATCICAAALLLAGCDRHVQTGERERAPPKPTTLAPSPQVVDFTRRLFGPGRSLADACVAGSTETIRIIRYDGLAQPALPSERGDGARPFGPAGYTVRLLADGEGAVAQWHGIGELHEGYGFVLYGAQSVRLDGNGWRQVQQWMREPRFLHMEPFSVEMGEFAPHTEPPDWWIEHCRDGRYRLLGRVGEPDDDGSREFHRVARSVLRLSGDVYPGDPDDPRRLP
jgi:hypothetical protein